MVNKNKNKGEEASGRVGSEHAHVAKRFVASERMKKALPQGAMFDAKTTPRPSTSPIATHAP